MQQRVLNKLAVLQTTKKLLAFYGTRRFCAHKGSPLVPVLDRMNLAHAFPHYFLNINFNTILRGRVSAEGTETRYGLDGPGIESRSGHDFPHPSRPALGLTQPSVQWVPGLSLG